MIFCYKTYDAKYDFCLKFTGTSKGEVEYIFIGHSLPETKFSSEGNNVLASK